MSAIAVNSDGARPGNLAAWLLKTAWWSILLGVAMQILTLVAARLLGAALPEVGVFLRDLSQKITWSSLVCVGLAIGNAASNMRPIRVGLVGLMAAPLSFIVARTAQKGTATALQVAPPDVMGDAIFAAMLLLKAAEYALLGFLLAGLARAGVQRAAAYVLRGSLVGLGFGGLVLLVHLGLIQPPPGLPKLLLVTINEVVFPVGCSLVLFASTRLGQMATGR
jgi:hypothetical protein